MQHVGECSTMVVLRTQRCIHWVRYRSVMRNGTFCLEVFALFRHRPPVTTRQHLFCLLFLALSADVYLPIIFLSFNPTPSTLVLRQRLCMFARHAPGLHEVPPRHGCLQRTRWRLRRRYRRLRICCLDYAQHRHSGQHAVPT